MWLTPLSGDRGNGTNTRSADAALIVGRYKLIVGNISQASWCGPAYPNRSSANWDTWATTLPCTVPPHKRGCLFDVFADPSEHTDLADAHPEVVSQLLARLQALDETLFDPPRGKADHAGACAQVEANRGFWGPWLPNGFAAAPQAPSAKIKMQAL